MLASGMKNSASNSVIFPLGLSGVAQTTILHNAWTSMGDEGPAETQTHCHAPNISHRSHPQLYNIIIIIIICITIVTVAAHTS